MIPVRLAWRHGPARHVTVSERLTELSRSIQLPAGNPGSRCDQLRRCLALPYVKHHGLFTLPSLTIFFFQLTLTLEVASIHTITLLCTGIAIRYPRKHRKMVKDWNSVHDEIHRLYKGANLPLREVMRLVKGKTGFTAS